MDHIVAVPRKDRFAIPWPGCDGRITEYADTAEFETGDKTVVGSGLSIDTGYGGIGCVKGTEQDFIGNIGDGYVEPRRIGVERGGEGLKNRVTKGEVAIGGVGQTDAIGPGTGRKDFR